MPAGLRVAVSPQRGVALAPRVSLLSPDSAPYGRRPPSPTRGPPKSPVSRSPGLQPYPGERLSESFRSVPTEEERRVAAAPQSMLNTGFDSTDSLAEVSGR